MATGAFASCTIDHTGRRASIIFGAPAPNDWNDPLSEDGDPPTVTVNGLAIPTVTLSSDINLPSLSIVVTLQGVVHLNDVVTLDGDAGWHTDASAVDQTGAMSGETITNNSKQLQDEV